MMRTRWLVACAVGLLMTVLAARSAASAPQGRGLASYGPAPRPVPGKTSDAANDGVDSKEAKDVAAGASTASVAALPEISGPAAPIAPAVINRDEHGKATIRAVRLERPLRVDGRIDEEFYRIVPPITDFIQQIPNEGAPATEPTEVWVFYDKNNLYIAVRCIDSHP